jgi:hypothetical protein
VCEQVLDFLDGIAIVRKSKAVAMEDSDVSLLRSKDVEDLAKTYPKLAVHMLDFREVSMRTTSRQRGQSIWSDASLNKEAETEAEPEVDMPRTASIASQRWDKLRTNTLHTVTSTRVNKIAMAAFMAKREGREHSGITRLSAIAGRDHRANTAPVFGASDAVTLQILARLDELGAAVKRIEGRLDGEHIYTAAAESASAKNVQVVFSDEVGPPPTPRP